MHHDDGGMCQGSPGIYVRAQWQRGQTGGGSRRTRCP
ncbi:hypothetical protein E2C01_099532 [Portunus trituberculatus]|uniref:Uncharacterized protein n=1 Tax=Portunus trituberculatus TaxID=210409 RepID=A0A5B7KAM1_PORTR|nr:hypothetical protein [Portunus trituberculatus]